MLALFFMGVMYSFVVKQVGGDRGVDQTYLLPSEFEGCVVINYNVKGALPLKIEQRNYL